MRRGSGDGSLWISTSDRRPAGPWAFLDAWHRGAMPKALAARYALGEMHAAGIELVRAGALTLRGDWI